MLIKLLLAKLRSPALNKNAILVNLVIFIGLAYTFWLQPPRLPFKTNLCTPLTVTAMALSLIGVILIQVLLHIFKGVLDLIKAKMGIITIENLGSSNFRKTFFLWDESNPVQWFILALIAAIAWIVGISQVAVGENRDPPVVLQFSVDYQDGSVPRVVKNSGIVAIPLAVVTLVQPDLPDDPIFNCTWSTLAARLNDPQACKIKYSPKTAGMDLLKLTVRSACSPKISEGSLTIQISP